MNLFYTIPEHISGSQITLEGQEAKHVSKVLRYRKGDAIRVTDGVGSMYEGVVQKMTEKTVSVDIRNKKTKSQPTPGITIAIGMIKKRDRLEFAVEKAVELGANRIWVYNADHSEKTNVRMDRLESVALSAMKQSLRVWLPEIKHLESLDETINHFENPNYVVADETSDKNEISIEQLRQLQSFMAIVGPEGGFSERERDLMGAHEVAVISLGKNRLRTETAALALMSQFI